MAALQLQYSGTNLPPLALVSGAAPVVLGRSKDATAGGLVDPFVSRKHASFAWASEDSVALTAHSKVHVVVRGALDAVPVDAGITTTASPSDTLHSNQSVIAFALGRLLDLSCLIAPGNMKTWTAFCAARAVT